MGLVAGLDLDGSSVTAWVADSDRPGSILAEVARPLFPLRPAPHRVELDPAVWEQSCREALRGAFVAAGRPGGDYLGLTVSTPRQGFVLLDGAGRVLGNGILEGDRRGAAHMGVLAGTYRLTGHGPAPELALPKLLAVRAEEPERWAATARLLFLHDWLVWRMTGVQVTEVSYACAGGMADVAARGWACCLLEECGIGASRLAPVVEAGTVVGELGDGWALPATLPVVAGCGDIQLAAMGAGGMGDGVVTVVAGSSTPVQAATASPVHDPLGRAWVSTHAARDRWAAEGEGEVNAGCPGTLSHAFAVRGNVEDLERALGRRAEAIVVCAGAAAGGQLPRLLAKVLGRDVHHASGTNAVAAAGTVLVARAVGAHAHVPTLPPTVLPAGDRAPYDEPYARWHAAHVLRGVHRVSTR